MASMNIKGNRGLSPIVPTTALFLGIAIAIVPWQAQAGRYELAQENLAEGIMGVMSDPDACMAYGKNLKEFENRPYGMVCRRELDPKLGFTRPTWKKLDILTHIPLTLAIIKFAHWEATWLPKDPKLWDARVKEMVEKENLTMDLTQLDLKGDGKLENLVRLGYVSPCDPKLEIQLDKRWENVRAHRRLFVADETLTKVDPYSNKGFFSSVLDDVFLYKGKVYTDVFTPLLPDLQAHKKHIGRLDLLGFGKYGATLVCTFKYSDTPISSGGHPQ
jgi:hypothetical protein